MCSSPQRPCRRAETGFVLVATLWIIAIALVGAAFIARWTENALTSATDERAALAAEIEMRSTEATVDYLLATRRVTHAGLGLDLFADATALIESAPLSFDAKTMTNVLTLDDTVYQGVGEARFALQDEGGLISLNAVNLDHLGQLIGLLGVPWEERGPMLEKLFDYTDRDDLRRLNGAESKDYLRAGKAPPRNRWLFTGQELGEIMGWDAQRALFAEKQLWRLVNTLRNAPPNFNTAPREVLQTYTGLDGTDADHIIARRRVRPFTDLTQVYAVIGKRLAIDPLSAVFFPARGIRLTLWHPGARQAREIHLQLTPLANDARPWLTEYQLNFTTTEDWAKREPVPPQIAVFSAPDTPDEQ